MNPVLTIAVQCHFFQRRLNWQLCSLSEQTRKDLVMVDVAYIDGNGDPETVSVCDMFSDLTIKDSVFDNYAVFAKRGNVRNAQLSDCKTEWILFTDSDMIYAPEYFERLAKELQSHKNAPYIIASGRRTTPKQTAIDLVNAICSYPIRIQGAFKAAQAIQVQKVKRPRGIGNFQLVNVRQMREKHGGVYVPEARDRGWFHPKGQNTKSDVHFRRRICATAGPVRALPEWFSHNVIHLNHERDKDIGAHCEEQR